MNFKQNRKTYKNIIFNLNENHSTIDKIKVRLANTNEN